MPAPLSFINNTPGNRILLNPIAVAAMLNSPTGVVMRSMMERATLVQEGAKHQVRLGHVHGGPGGRANLRDTIVKRIIPPDMIGPGVRVGSESPIALLHHEGTRPHVIMPRVKSRLVFVPKGGTGPVFATRVNHPGTAPNRFLTDNLHLALL